MARDPDSVDAETASLWVNSREQDRRIRRLEKMIDTRDSPWWKRLQWRLLDGYPPWYVVGSAQRRWWMFWMRRS